MAKSRKPHLKAITVRIDADLVDRARSWCRDQAGKPLYLTLSALVAAGIEREMQRQALVLGGALPLDRASGRDDDPPPAQPPRRRLLTINTHGP